MTPRDAAAVGPPGHRPHDGGRSVWRDAGVLIAGQGAAQACNLAALVVVARWLGQDGFGTLQLAVAVGGYALVAAELGLFTHGLREAARLDAAAVLRRFAGVQTTLLILLALVALALMTSASQLLPAARRAPLLFGLYLAAVLPQAFMHDWVALARGWTGLAAFARALRSAVYLAAVIALSAGLLDDGGRGLEAVAAVFLASLVVGNLVLDSVLRRRLGGAVGPATAPGAELRARLAATWPIGGGALIRRTLYAVDVVLLGALAGAAAVGPYAAVVKPGFVLVAAAEVVLGALTPRLARAWRDSRGAFRKQARRQLGALTAVAALAAVAGALAGPAVLARVYGPDFALDPAVVRALLIAYPLLGLGLYLHEMQTAADRQRRALGPLIAAAAVAVLGCVLLIPDHGARGAAYVMLAADFAYAAGGAWISRELWLRRGR